MAGPLVALLIAVGVVSMIFYRLQNRRAERRWSSDTAGGDVGYASDSGSSTFSFGDWFSSSSSPGGSGNPSDSGSSGGWDSGGDSSGSDDSGGGGGGDSGGGGGSD